MKHQITSNAIATHTRRFRGAHNRENMRNDRTPTRIRAKNRYLQKKPQTIRENSGTTTTGYHQEIRKFTTREREKKNRCRDTGRSGLNRRRVSEDACRLPGRSFDNGARLTGCPTNPARVPRLEKVRSGRGRGYGALA